MSTATTGTLSNLNPDLEGTSREKRIFAKIGDNYTALHGISAWLVHFTVLLPDRFHGGIIGAFLYAVTGAVLTGWALPEPGVPPDNPPGLKQALWPLPGRQSTFGCWWVTGTST